MALFAGFVIDDCYGVFQLFFAFPVEFRAVFGPITPEVFQTGFGFGFERVEGDGTRRILLPHRFGCCGGSIVSSFYRLRDGRGMTGMIRRSSFVCRFYLIRW